MRKESEQNRTAWSYRAYEFWNMQGSAEELAAKILENPRARLRYHGQDFLEVAGKRVANVCGSNGRIAVPLALLGGVVTVFDISEENRRYAQELAACAGVQLGYEVCDINELPLSVFGEQFDIAYCEGGVLHYFHDLDLFMEKLYGILVPSGTLILSDFHPFRKILRTGSAMMSVKQTEGNYFDDQVHEGDVAYLSFFSEEEQSAFPACSLRFYTLSEIVNSVIRAGFTLKELREHPNFEDRRFPGEFTIIASKS